MPRNARWGTLTLRDFHGPNAGYVLELYERYRDDPSSVDPQTRALFERWQPGGAAAAGGGAAAPGAAVETIVGAANLAQSIREYGHLAARLDPLGSEPPGGVVDDLVEHRDHHVEPLE